MRTPYSIIDSLNSLQSFWQTQSWGKPTRLLREHTTFCLNYLRNSSEQNAFNIKVGDILSVPIFISLFDPSNSRVEICERLHVLHFLQAYAFYGSSIKCEAERLIGVINDFETHMINGKQPSEEQVQEWTKTAEVSRVILCIAR